MIILLNTVIITLRRLQVGVRITVLVMVRFRGGVKVGVRVRG
jgi:hypothetical protein